MKYLIDSDDIPFDQQHNLDAILIWSKEVKE